MMDEMLFGFSCGVMAGLVIALPMVDRCNKRARKTLGEIKHKFGGAGNE